MRVSLERLETKLDGCALGRKIREAGWTSVQMPGEVQATALSFSNGWAAHRAMLAGA